MSDAPAPAPSLPFPLVGFDTETYLIGPDAIIPKLVCAQYAIEKDDGSGYDSAVQGTGDQRDLDALLDMMLDPKEQAHIVGHHICYDLAVIAKARPDLIPAIFNSILAGRIHDTEIREKLLTLATTGDLKYITLPDGSKRARRWRMLDLVKDTLGIDLSSAKEDDDAWRLNYSTLDNVPVAQWPAEAVQYAIDDCVYPIKIFHDQQQRAAAMQEKIGHDVFRVEAFRVGVSFVLQMVSARGVAIDPDEKAKVEAMIGEELKPEKLQRLVAEGILRPEVPASPYANGAKDHRPDCTDPKTCQCPVKMKAGKAASINRVRLEAYVEQLAARDPRITIKRNEPTEKKPEGSICVDGDWLDDHASLDPVLQEYADRQALQKLVTTELPRLNWENKTAPIVWPNFDNLKESGRCSSYGGDKYPSFNCQQIDPRARGMYIPRPGMWMFSIDFGAMELVSNAQKCLDLFGFSVLAEKLNAGVDPHAYLGAQLAFNMDPDFQATCQEFGTTSPDQRYDIFASFKDEASPMHKFYKHWRKFAKPVGLGYPGGLGPDTFMTLAKANYGVVTDRDTAEHLRTIWKETYPEEVLYFKYVNEECVDPFNKGWDAEKQKEYPKYAYLSPFGMVRSNCDYCACANGQALQTPSAEGALLALFNVIRACIDPTKGSKAYGRVFPSMFVHDEIIGEIPANDPEAVVALYEVADIMVKSFAAVCPSVKIKAQPVIMLRWSKDAEPTFDADGRLIPWQPKEKN